MLDVLDAEVRAEPSVRDWLLQLQAGQDQAIEPLYAHFKPRFVAIASRSGLRDDAEDIAQDTFIKVVQRIDSFNPALGDGTAWVNRVFRNNLTDQLRKVRPTTDIVDHTEVLDTAFAEDPGSFGYVVDYWHGTPEAVVIVKERLGLLACAWARLTEADCQEIFRGRGRGPGRTAYHQAIVKLKRAFAECDGIPAMEAQLDD